MKNIHEHIKVENNKSIREYRIYYYRDSNVDENSKILTLSVDITSSKLNLEDKEFYSINNLNEYFNVVKETGKIDAYNTRDISRLLDKFIMDESYIGIEVILPYYEETYEDSDIKVVYDLFVEKLHIEIDNE